MPRPLQRGPISAIILASTKEDIRKCSYCQPCSIETHPMMDLTMGELLQKATRNDPTVFSSKSLWFCDPIIVDDERCHEGINLSLVIEALRNEAKLRGYSNIGETNQQK